MTDVTDICLALVYVSYQKIILLPNLCQVNKLVELVYGNANTVLDYRLRRIRELIYSSTQSKVVLTPVLHPNST